MEKLLPFIVEHWVLWSTLVAVIILLVIEETQGQWMGVSRLSPQEVVQLINRDQAIVIDIRDKTAFESGHIINAVNLPKDELNNKKLEKHKEKTLVFVNGQAQLPTGLTKELRTSGFKLASLKGGIAAWKDAGLPLTKD